MTSSVAPTAALHPLALDYASERVGKRGIVVHADCLDWMNRLPEASIHAVVTDPPYGVKEFDAKELKKLHNGNKGGIWRIPPSFDGHVRSPLPRFTALNAKERAQLSEFFTEWSRLLTRVLKPGAHVLVAGNTFMSQLVWTAIVDGGLEFRGEIVRLVRTLRGGDRPKGYEEEFPNVTSMPRGCYEPWGIFRKALPPKMTVGECLRTHGTGGLRRLPDGRPFADVIMSERTPKRERAVADHPSIKPQSILRQLVYASLPLGEGTIADPFMGSGSTVAAAEAMGLNCVGVERYADYYGMARSAIEKLAGLRVDLHAHDENLLLELE
jgi:site-specific DNA-methyltransferase (adenine-specific)